EDGAWPAGSVGNGYVDIGLADVDLPAALDAFRDDLVREPHFGFALAAQPAVELRMLFLELRLLWIDEVRLAVERLQAEEVALFELLGEERLLEPKHEGDRVRVLVAIDFDLVLKRQRFVLPERRLIDGGAEKRRERQHDVRTHGEASFAESM